MNYQFWQQLTQDGLEPSLLLMYITLQFLYICTYGIYVYHMIQWEPGTDTLWVMILKTGILISTVLIRVFLIFQNYLNNLYLFK